MFSRYSSKIFLILVLALCGLAGCVGSQGTRGARVAGELHERLSHTIQRLGFSHGVQGIRHLEREVDSIYVAVPLDSLKRQHQSLDKMLTEVAKICVLPEFENYAIDIELSSNEETDMRYLQSTIAPIVAGSKNVKVQTVREPSNNIIITTSIKRR